MVGTRNRKVNMDEALSYKGIGWYNLALVCTCSLQLMSIAIDLFGFTLVVTVACDLDLNVVEKGILASIPFLGIILVSYPWGYIADTRGRKFTLLLALNIGFIFSCLCSIAPGWKLLAFLKFLSACFSCAANSVTYTLVGETCTRQNRSRNLLLMTCMLILGPGTAALLAYPTLHNSFAVPLPGLGINFTPWRLLCIVLAIPMGVGGIAMFFFYESPKFLANIGRQEEALAVLKKICIINHGFNKDTPALDSIKIKDYLSTYDKKSSIWRSMWTQTAPLFRAPLLRRTLQLFYLVCVVYITNNSFLTWLAHIMNLVKGSLAENGESGNICQLITRNTRVSQNGTTRVRSAASPCSSTLTEDTMWVLCVTSLIFSTMNFIISHLHAWRRIVLITILSVSTLSGVLINIVPEPISSTVFYMLFCGTNVAMGILASFFVEFYPTSYRGMVACLSIMVGRSSSFIGINVVINTLFRYCRATIWSWCVLLLSGVVTAWYLPSDKSYKPPVEFADPTTKSNTRPSKDFAIGPATGPTIGSTADPTTT